MSNFMGGTPRQNLILMADSYKYSHREQYPPGTQFVSSYIESRGGSYDTSVFFGLQYFLKEYLSNPITKDNIDEAEALITAHGEPFYREGWEYILEKYDGYLPLEIQAVPEGSVIPTRNVLAQIKNTDANCFWLTSFMETAILQAVWYPTTVATISKEIKKTIFEFLEETADAPEIEVAFKLHDFGYRGVSSQESAGIGGLAHLVNFMGTDTVRALVFGRDYYSEPVAGFSIPASEHSTITSWGGPEMEKAAFSNMIQQYGGQPNPDTGLPKMFACVSDSYNIWDAIKTWKSLEDELVTKGGILVVRPDSGNPVAVATSVVDKLMDEFGYTINSKGYKVLPDYIRVIQGDGVNSNSIREILQELKNRGISASNIAFGMGGALLQQLNRDTLNFAMKCSAIDKGNGWEDVYKQPVGSELKVSKKGRLDLIKIPVSEVINNETDDYLTVPENKNNNSLLQTVWENGELLVDQTFAEIRERAQ